MSSSSETQKDTRKIPRKRKRAFNFCSTPEEKNLRKLSSISISAIDTNSSSSTKETKKKKRLKKYNLEQRRGKKVEKTSKTRGAEKKKKKKLIRLRPLDDEWETCDEDLQHSAEFETNVLFKDIQSPEHIRDAPPFVPDYLDSPILGVRGLRTDSPQISFEESPEKLPVKDLPSSRLQFDDSEDEDLILRKPSTVKTYPNARNKKLKKDYASNQEHMPWLVNVSIPTTSSDLLWENFVRNNYDKFPKYFRSPDSDRHRNDIGSDADETFIREGNYDKLSRIWNGKISLRNNTKIMRGQWNKSLRKWIRNNDIYNFRENANDDIYNFQDEAKRNKKTSKKLVTLKQFRRKMNARRNISKLGSSSSSVDATDIAENSSFKIRRTKVRKLKSQLNNKAKTMFSNDSSTDSPLKYPKPSSVLKRSYEDETYKKEDDTKKIRLTPKKRKPKIISEELIAGVQLKKDKKRKIFRIVKTVV